MIAKVVMTVRFIWLRPWVKQTHDRPVRNRREIAQGQRAVSALIGASLRRGDVKAQYRLSTLLTTPGTRDSVTATRTTTTRAIRGLSAQSASKNARVC